MSLSTPTGATLTGFARDNNVNRRVVLFFQETDAKGDVKLFGLGQTQSAVRQAGVWPGITLFPFDPGGYIRRMSYSINKLVTLPVLTAQVAPIYASPPASRRAPAMCPTPC